MLRRLASILLALVALFAVVGTARAQPWEPRLDAREDALHLLAIIAPLGHFELGAVGSDGYTFVLDGDDGRHLGDLNVGRTNAHESQPRVRSAHYTTKIWNASPDFTALDVLVRAADAVVASDGGPLPDSGIQVREGEDWEPMLEATLWLMAAGLIMTIWRGGRVTLDLRKPLIIQACVQSSIFVYWSLYWPGVTARVPMILLMLAVAYAADAACSFARYGSWRVGLSPVPIVLSTNLFVWLDWRGAVMAMVLAIVFKTFVQRRGRHVFNPSVAGLTVNAVCTVLFPDLVHFGGLFHTLNLAPNMAEWIFLVSLIPLTTFRLLPIPIGCVLGLWYVTRTGGALRPTLLLMMTLLATDPATTPKSGVGRMLFGFLVGVTYPLYSLLLRRLGQPDDFAKILAVPLPNLLAGELDAIAARIVALGAPLRARLAPRLEALAAGVPRLGGRLVPISTLLLLAVWSALFIIPFRREKPLDFEPSLHWNWGTPLVARGGDDVPRCADNPVFCETFSFVAEARRWMAWERAKRTGAMTARADGLPGAP